MRKVYHNEEGMFLHEFTVKGTKNFELCMLAKERCWPATVSDALAIERSFLDDGKTVFFVTLHHIDVSELWEPTTHLWNRLSWEIAE